MNIILHEPEIPFNTGAIGRTCVATDTRLHLIRPYGFILNDKNIKRAGMDYWEKLQLSEYNSYEEFLTEHPEISFSESADGQDVRAERSDTVKAQGSGRTRSFERGQDVERPRLWFATTKAKQVYSEVQFGRDDYIMFGKESAGIPEEILVEHPESCIRIPMWGDIRSLNLSNSVSILLYEALRQNDFDGMRREGELHRLRW